MRIKDTLKIDRPQEKLVKYGTKRLTEAELLAIILRTGTKDTNVVELSKKILRKFRDKITQLEIKELEEMKGLGETKACQVIAVIEFGKRLIENNSSIHVFSAKEAFNSVKEIRESKKEHLVAFYIDTQNCEISREVISIGTLNANLIHPREIFEPALKKLAAGIVILHNHPSGSVNPSDEDIVITKQLVDAGDIMGIQIIDHIIVTKDNYFSFNDNDVALG